MYKKLIAGEFGLKETFWKFGIFGILAGLLIVKMFLLCYAYSKIKTFLLKKRQEIVMKMKKGSMIPILGGMT